MLSQQEQAVVQAASDTYVAAQQGGLVSETNLLHQRRLELYSHGFPW